ncbi:nuclear GTPase SLIP-GC-like isoform X2 [Triplophysa dalaica]|uniref:nuclear GTPase SLIP-GC-like isoform X2 n=1 Tax=Triplophysa dalaica TaxID=1582913 RepID=UPI0024E03E3A|nr:nuclear GTPase SLIP-GC-like isoform X2 [Triplophysa dalaica]
MSGLSFDSVLVTLALKCYASQLFQGLEKHMFYIFKLSVIVCFPPEDQVKVHAIVTYSTDEKYDIVMIRRGNSEPFHLTSVGSEPEVWDGEESDESDDILYCFTLPPATRKIMYAVVTLQESNELTVIPTNWLNEHKTQCYWPPFKTPEKCLDVIKNKLEPAKGIHSWELLNIVCHWEHDTYKLFKEIPEVVSEQVERMYAAVTLQESKELTVIPTNWLNENKTQCHWPPFKTPEKCLDVIKNRLEPARGINAWKQLHMVFHGEYAAYKQAKEKCEAVGEQMEWPSTSLGCFEKQKTINPIHTALTSQSTQTFGVKRKRDDESTDISWQSLLITDMDEKKKPKQIMDEINVKVQAIQDTDPTITIIKTHILDAISKMNEDTRKKETIGIFGRTGEGKSSLLNAVLGDQFLLPSGGCGACTAVITQVEANLNDSNYIAEIDLISKEEWDEEFALSNEVEENQLTEMTKERITALFGAEAEEKSLEELKRDDRYKEIFNDLSTGKKIISSSDPSAFASNVVCYLENSVANPGGCYWPLVKSVTIKIPNCRELLEHIVLIDLPGTGDCNKIRDDLWKTKIRECSAVWIVSDIKRAITDRDPWGILDHCIEDLGPGGECKHINFICTKTDDMKPAEYLRSVRLTEAQISGQGLESKERFITDVFTVSSTAFFDQELHLKNVETEIPKLRDILINRNKTINQKLTGDYINEAKGILSLLQSVQLDKDKNMTKARILKDLQTDLEKNLKLLDDHFEGLYEKLKKCLLKGVEESVRSCVKTTQDMLSSVRPKCNRGFHRIFRAMCCRGGFYWPRNWNAPLDLNKCLSKHMYDSINKEFVLMFPVDDIDKTEKSMQDKLDKFSIILPTTPMLYPIHIFIQTQENKLKASLSRVIVEKKKEIYLTIYAVIEWKMAPGYKKASEVKGEGSMQRMEKAIMETIDELKVQMFNEAKVEMLEMFNNLKLHIMKTLESELKTSVNHSLSQICKFNLLDVSREIQELEKLSAAV